MTPIPVRCEPGSIPMMRITPTAPGAGRAAAGVEACPERSAPPGARSRRGFPGFWSRRQLTRLGVRILAEFGVGIHGPHVIEVFQPAQQLGDLLRGLAGNG